MAYGNYIAAINWSDVIRLRAAAQQTLEPTKIIFVSHLAAYWITERPLGECLRQILDGGQELSPSFWHPLRVPVVHSPDEVRALESSLRIAWCELSPEVRASHAFRYDITEILTVLNTAVRTESAVVSVLEPPVDAERADRVACPFKHLSELTEPWGSLSILFGNLSKT